MAQQQSLAEFFEQCERLAAQWRFDQVTATSEDVLFESEDEDNFVKSFVQVSTETVWGKLTAKQRTDLKLAMAKVSEAMIEALKVKKIGTRLRMMRLTYRKSKIRFRDDGWMVLIA